VLGLGELFIVGVFFCCVGDAKLMGRISFHLKV